MVTNLFLPRSFRKKNGEDASADSIEEAGKLTLGDAAIVTRHYTATLQKQHALVAFLCLGDGARIAVFRLLRRALGLV